MQPKRIFWKDKEPSFRRRVEEAMPAITRRNSGKVLKGRAKCVGGSEIMACAFKVVMSKRMRTPRQFDALAKFFRGHRQEEFNAPIHRQISHEDGIYWQSQVLCELREQPRLRAHVDNVYFVSPSGRIEDSTDIFVAEEKNAKALPETPHEEHVWQLHYQIGLLKDNFPQAEVCGQIYGTDLNGEHTDFDLLVKYQPTTFANLVKRGKNLLEHIDKSTLPAPEPGLLCGFCPFIDRCPKWTSKDDVPAGREIQVATMRYAEVTAMIKKLESEKAALRDHLKPVLTRQGKNWFKGQVAEGYFVQISEMPGRESVNTAALKADHPELAEQYLKKGKPSTRLQVVRKR